MAPSVIALCAFFALTLAAQERAPEESWKAETSETDSFRTTVSLLDEIIFPELKIENATLQEAVSTLTDLAKTHDTRDIPIEDKGIQFDIAEEPIQERAPEALESKITLNLRSVPLHEAIRYTCDLASLKFIIEPNLVRIVPPADPDDETLFTRRYDLTADKFAETDAKTFLETRGIQFKGEALALFRPERDTLVVRNTQSELAKTDRIVHALNSKELNDAIQQLTIPEFKLEQATLKEAIAKLQKATVTHDHREKATGIKFIIDEQRIGEASQEALKTPITLDLNDSPIVELLRHITEFVGVTYQVDTFAVKIVPLPAHKRQKRGPGDVFLQGHLKLQQGRRLEDQRDYKAASACLAEAIEFYDEIARTWPTWQKEMVERRRTKVRRDLTRLKALTSRETGPTAFNKQGQGFLKLIDSSWSDDGPDNEPQTPEERRKADEDEKLRWEAMKRHMAELIIPDFSVKDVTLKEAVETLKTLSIEHDKRDVPEDRRGINVLIDERKINSTNPESLAKPFSLQAKKSSFKALLDYIMEFTGLHYRVEPYAVVVVPVRDAQPKLITRSYQLRPGQLVGDAMDVLTQHGIVFPKGSSVNFIPLTSKLVVRTSLDQLARVDDWVNSLK